MMEEELIKIWQSPSNQERVQFEKSRLMAEMQTSLDRFHRIMKWADRRGILVTFSVMACFTFYVYIIPFTLSKIASGLVVLFAINVYMQLRKANRNKLKSFEGTYLEYLGNTRNYLLDQKHLAETALYWCVIPAISLSNLFAIGFMELPFFTVTRTIIVCVGFTLVGVGVYFLNKFWVEIHITTNLKKIDELIRALEEL